MDAQSTHRAIYRAIFQRHIDVRKRNLTCENPDSLRYVAVETIDVNASLRLCEELRRIGTNQATMDEGVEKEFSSI